MSKNTPLALAFHALFVSFLAAPLLAVVLVSFTDKGFMSMPFDGASLRWYRALLHAPEFLRALNVSLQLAVLSATLSIGIAVPAALALARHRFIGRDSIAGFLLSPLMIPHVVLGVAFLRFFSQLGFGGSFVGLAAAHILVITPYALRLCLSAAGALDTSIERAAVSLGARPTLVFRRVTLPMIVPGVVSGWALAFIHSFDEVTMSTFLSSPSVTTLPVALYHRIEDSIDPMVASISTVLILMAAVLMMLIDRVYGLSRVFTGHHQ